MRQTFEMTALSRLEQWVFGSRDAWVRSTMVASNPMDARRRPRTQLLRIAAVMSTVGIAVFTVAFWLHPAEIQKHEIQSPSAASTTCIGADRCAGCHVQEAQAWRRSHHAQAMQEANASTVLGN